MPKHILPIFLSCSMDSADRAIDTIAHIANRASATFTYYIHVLHTDLPNRFLQRAHQIAHKGCFIFFENIGPWLETARSLFPMPNCYEDPTHFYFYASDMFPEYRKAIYLSAEGTTVTDIEALYTTDIGDCLVGAFPAVRTAGADLAANHNHPSGSLLTALYDPSVLLLNCDELRRHHMSDRFLRATAQSHGKNLPSAIFLSQLCRDRVMCIRRNPNHAPQTSPAPAV